MTDIPETHALAAAYNEKLAGRLLEIANSQGKISASEFSAQLESWAVTNLRYLNQELDLNSKPSTSVIRAQLKDVSNTAKKLFEQLLLLPSEAGDAIREELYQAPASQDIKALLEGNKALENLMLGTQGLSEASKKGANKLLKARRGEKQRRNIIRTDCVADLAYAWQLLTDQMPTRRNHGPDHSDVGHPYGAFNEFVTVALTPLLGPVDATKGIDDVIKRTIQVMGNNPDELWCQYFHI